MWHCLLTIGTGAQLLFEETQLNCSTGYHWGKKKEKKKTRIRMKQIKKIQGCVVSQIHTIAGQKG